MKNILFFFVFLFCSITQSQEDRPSIHQQQLEYYKNKELPPVEKIHVLTGLDVLIMEKTHLIMGKNIGLVTNHTGVDRNDNPNFELLMKLDDMYLKAIFAPEHGFFGNVSAGKKVTDQSLNNFPIIFSLYGKTRKPTLKMLEGLDLIIYDMQDVGARFYTYISTMGLVMEAAAEANIPVMILDRPNPLGGDKIEGPVLDMNFKSFVGKYPIPIRYGLTIGEMAKMIIGEKWISAIPELTVIKMKGWRRGIYFNETDLKMIPPSPNIPDIETAVIYPGMCLIEGTNISEGRGTDHPFKWIGAPWINGRILSQMMNKKHLPGVVFEPVSFTPISIPGRALNPKYENEQCHGVFIKIIDYRQFKSVLTGIHLITTIRGLYPDNFEVKSSLPRLWGNNDLSGIKTINIDPDELLNKYERSLEAFKEHSSTYYIYK